MINLRRKNIAVLAISCAFLVVFILAEGRVSLDLCVFRKVTSIPCPGCGGMRSAGLLLHGDIAGALMMNPLSVLLLLFFVVSAVWLFIDTVRGIDTYWKIYKVQWRKWAVVAAVAVLVLNWVWNIMKFGVG